MYFPNFLLGFSLLCLLTRLFFFLVSARVFFVLKIENVVNATEIRVTSERSRNGSFNIGKQCFDHTYLVLRDNLSQSLKLRNSFVAGLPSFTNPLS